MRDDVQFHWSMISVDIENEDHNCELLRHIVELWLTIRGFGISNAWVENYKSVLKSTVKISK